MKKPIVELTAFAFIAVFLLTSCNSSEKKVEDTKVEVVETNEDLKVTKEEYLTDIENYKKALRCFPRFYPMK